VQHFIARCADRVAGTLSGFDRLVFRGTLRQLAHVAGLQSVLAVEGVLLKDFGAWAQGLTDTIKDEIRRTVEAQGRPLLYLPSGATRKEEVARKILEEDPVEKGLICMLSAVEPCRSYEIRRDRERKRLVLEPRTRKCLFYYQYHLDPRFGFLNVRVQTWLPFGIQICLNGREWLAHQLTAAGSGFERSGNCFLQLEDPVRAQRLMHDQLRTPWPRELERLARPVAPVQEHLFGRVRVPYYWTTHQMEWATDLAFRKPSELAEVYPLLVHHAITHLHSDDVLRFLGNRQPSRFRGQVVSDYKRRHEGVRVKHRVQVNSIKVYDKAPNVLRVETTIHRARDLKVWRSKEGDPGGPCSWRRIRKGIADLHRLTELSQSSNERYLDALAEVDPKDAPPLQEVLADVTRRQRWKGRSVRALRPCAQPDGGLIEAVCHGEHLITGFRNRDLYRHLHGDRPCTRQLRKRRTARITRHIRVLRAHGLVRKVPKTHRYLVTAKGLRVLTACVALRQAPLALLTTRLAA
jgi:hypothetical protein